MNLAELIEYFEDKQKRYPNLTPISKKVTDATLRELKGKKVLLNRINDDMYKKTCYRYGTHEPIDCDKCERCLKAEDLQWNEGDEMVEMGDILITLIIMAQQRGYEIKDCLTHAYLKIKDRQGEVIDGSFVKAEDIGKVRKDSEDIGEMECSLGG